ncbi:MAG: hypothetical protein HYU66_18850 [Armatimonadetes bacterium]|nr:hypothetical protein [Armatimonadota bacterium]
MDKEAPYPPGLLQDWLVRNVFVHLYTWQFWLAIAVTVVAFFALLYAMQRFGSAGRRRLTVVCTFLAGFYYALSFFLPPGHTLAGKVIAGTQTYRFEGESTWLRDQPEGAPEDAPPVPAVRHLAGKILLTQPVEDSDAKDQPEPQEGRDFITVEGTQGPDGSWQLTQTTAGGPRPLAAAERGYSVDLNGVAGTLLLNPAPALNVAKAYETPLGNFLMVMGSFTIGLGVINLLMIHGRTLATGGSGWINSLGFFVGFLGMTVFGLWQTLYKVDPADPTIPFAVAGYRFFFDGLLTPLQSTTFALLGFFIVSAAYRAFRIQNTEAALMTIIAFVVMLGSVPLGQLLTAWLPEDGPASLLRLENVANWLLTKPNAAAFRGILFGAATGGFALSLRVWLSLEGGAYLGKEF